jgi:triphosphoribosyl-dephospho-CoA synthase
MLAATGGVNTHRGAIFGLGLFCAAAGACEAGRVRPPKLLGTIVALSWGTDILAGSAPDNSHGRDACRRYGAGGARQEAAGGFASVHEIGAPALAAGARLASGDAEAGRVQACFALIAVVEDTNVLHRGGSAGLRFAQAAAQTFLDAGGVGRPGWREHAQAVHRAFVARRLSPGGSADLLAMSLFVRAYEERCLRRAPPH